MNKNIESTVIIVSILLPSMGPFCVGRYTDVHIFSIIILIFIFKLITIYLTVNIHIYSVYTDYIPSIQNNTIYLIVSFNIFIFTCVSAISVYASVCCWNVYYWVLVYYAYTSATYTIHIP